MLSFKKLKNTTSPVKLLTIAVCFTIAVFVILGFNVWDTYRSSKSVQRNGLAVLSLGETITRLAQARTMSAQLAATSNDPKWLKKYDFYRAELARAIQRGLTLAPEFGVGPSLQTLHMANRRMLQLEYEVMQQGKGKPIFSNRLASDEYIEYQTNFSKYINQLSERLEENAIGKSHVRTRWAYIALAGMILVLPILVAAWVRVIQILRSHIAERTSFEDKLKSSHSDLEKRVFARTKELANLNVKLQCELSDRKQMEAQLRLSDRLASMGTLTAGVAHEINNPLSYVIINIKLALQELVNVTPKNIMLKCAELKEMLEQADEGSERVRQIVRDMKTLSRPEKEEEEAKLVPCDVQKILEASIHMASNEIRHRAHVIRDFGNIPFAMASEARLGQVFLNLLVNAAQALPDGAASENTIRVSTSVNNRGEVTIEIVDSGPGIPKEIIDRIFDPFFTTKSVGVGTGLGLSICHRIVSSFEGKISIASPPGNGTKVLVSLKAASKVDKYPQTEKTPSIEKRTEAGRILIIDDEVTVAKCLSRLLRSHEVKMVHNGSDALETLHDDNNFDVIFCDLMMPEKTGMDIFEELSSRAPELAAKMVFMTGGAFSPQARAFLDDVENQKIEKPFDVGSVQKILQHRIPSN